jgi:hypothetical protein
MLTIRYMDKGGIIRADSEVETFVNKIIKSYLRNKSGELALLNREVKVSNHLICQSFRVAIKEGKIPAEEVCFRNGDYAEYPSPDGSLYAGNNVDGGDIYENNLIRILGW